MAALLPFISDTPVRIVVGLVFVLCVPGYAFIAALFPEAGSGPTTDRTGDVSAQEASGIDGIERVALSFGLSIALVPLVGLVLNFTTWGIRLVPILVSLSGLTLALTAVAAVRRWTLPTNKRFRVPYRVWIQTGRDELFAPSSRTDAILNVLLVVSILLAFGSVGYAITVPNNGEQFNEFYLLTEGEDGKLVADGYQQSSSKARADRWLSASGTRSTSRRNTRLLLSYSGSSVSGTKRRYKSGQSFGGSGRRSRTTKPGASSTRFRPL